MIFDTDPRTNSKAHRGSKETVYPKYVRESKERDQKLKGSHYGNWLPIDSNQTRGYQKEIFRATSLKGNELVKYMSRLPGYVQRLDSTETSQDKAFNVGVLDLSTGKSHLRRHQPSSSLQLSETKTHQIVPEWECSPSDDKHNRRNSDASINDTSDFRKITRSLSFREPSTGKHTSRDSPLRRTLDALRKINKSSFSNSQRMPSYTHNACFNVFMKNNAPLFRFSSENANAVLAATQSSPKCYAVYSIGEMKKKSNGWISYPTTEKNNASVYNAIGSIQMDTSSFSLFDCDTSRTELAAMEILAGNKVTVLLPGAIHTMPKEGRPSPLIQRWRSNGVCDCGGWDVGCKLWILTNRNQSNVACLELFSQEKCERWGHVFSLTLHEKGMYSVKFDPMISSLQAFFICVSLTCANLVHKHVHYWHNTVSGQLFAKYHSRD